MCILCKYINLLISCYSENAVLTNVADFINSIAPVAGWDRIFIDASNLVNS